VLKRIGIYLGILFGFTVLFFGYFWLGNRRERAELAKESESFIHEEQQIGRGLESLGDIDLQPDELTRAKLAERFHQPDLIRPGSHNSTKLGWACGNERCALWFHFLNSSGREIGSKSVPAAITLSSPVMRATHTVAIGGVYLGEPVEEMKDYCKKRGYGLEEGYHRIAWDKDWTIIWADSGGVVSFLTFLDEKQLKSGEAGNKG
jgi:hypothetical protein